MTFQYAVAIFGPGSSSHGPVLKRRLRKRLSELSTVLPSAVKFLKAAEVPRANGKLPIVGVCFGGDAWSNDDSLAIRSLLAKSNVIIPVVSDINRFNLLVPTELAGINGMEISADNNQLDSIANLVLENLGLLRRSRRLFISYRRIDSAKEALQLRHELEARGYDVFLDTHSVPKGDDFQEVLWQRLADSDVAVLLDTPGFLTSRWTQEELAQAEAMTIGIVQVVWPAHSPAPYTDLCERIYLNRADVGATGLGVDAVKRILEEVERLRARSLAARHNNLVREFCDAAATVGIAAVVQPGRYISAHLPSGEMISAIPAVGVPEATRYHEASARFSEHASPPAEIFLIYDQRGLRPGWSKFLDWLDEFLPVKAVRITNVAKKLVK